MLRRFSKNTVGEENANKEYEVIEVIENPTVDFNWRWDSGECPNCHQPIVREVKHQFYRVEILSPKGEATTENNIVLIGDTLDRRKMLIHKSRPEFKKLLVQAERNYSGQ